MSTPMVSLKTKRDGLVPDLDNEILMSVECDEPGGTVVRHIRQMQLTPNNLRIFWEKTSKFRTLFSEELRNSFPAFIRVVLKGDASKGEVEPTGLFWVVDDFVGVFYMTDIQVGVDAVVHYTFFDGRHKGRINLCKEMIKYAFKEFEFRRLSAQIPLYATDKTRNFVGKSLGFRLEGRKRKAVRFDDEWFDVSLYGILREEI